MNKILLFIIIFAIFLLVTPLIVQAVIIESPLQSDDFGVILTNITGLLRDLAIIVGAIMIIISGIQYMTSAGNEEKATKAKKTMLYTVIGVAIVIAAKFIVDFIQELLGGS